MSVSPRVRDAILRGPKPEPEAIPYDPRPWWETAPVDVRVTDDDYRTIALYYTMTREELHVIEA